MSDTCNVYEFEVKTPVEIKLTVEIDRWGMIDHIAGETYDDIAIDDDLRVMRAVAFLTHLIQGTQEGGALLEDAVRDFPAGTDFNIERSIVAALARLQKQVLADSIQRRGAA